LYRQHYGRFVEKMCAVTRAQTHSFTYLLTYSLVLLNGADKYKWCCYVAIIGMQPSADTSRWCVSTTANLTFSRRLRPIAAAKASGDFARSVPQKTCMKRRQYFYILLVFYEYCLDGETDTDFIYFFSITRLLIWLDKAFPDIGKKVKVTHTRLPSVGFRS